MSIGIDVSEHMTVSFSDHMEGQVQGVLSISKVTHILPQRLSCGKLHTLLAPGLIHKLSILHLFEQIIIHSVESINP